jgi:hypothetical protein
MNAGARTPEELETLFEDAFVVRDREALGHLFEEGAVLSAGAGAQEARGVEQISRLAAAMWDGGCTYVADPRRIFQARDTALVLAERGVSVVRRGPDGAWRYAISVLAMDDATERRSDDAGPPTPAAR